MFKSSKIYKLICLLLVCIGISLIVGFIINPNYRSMAFDTSEAIASGQHSNKFGGVAAFKEIYRGAETILFNMLLLLVIPFVSHYFSCINRIKGTDNFIVTRIGLAKYYLISIVKSIKDIWYYPIIVNCFALFLINFEIPIFGEGLKNGFMYLVDSDIANFILLTLLQIIGWSILNIYCFLISQLINNKYIYSLFLILFNLLLIVVMSSGLLFLGSVVSFLDQFIMANAYWFSLIIPYNLIAPGAVSLFFYPENIRLIFIVCLLVVHIIILGIIFYYVYNRRKKLN